MGADDQAVDLLGRLELAGHPQLEAAAAQTDIAAGGVLVLALHRLLQGADGETVIGQFFREDLNPDLALEPAGDLHLEHAGDALDLVF